MVTTLKLQACAAMGCVFKASFSSASQGCVRAGLIGSLPLSRLPYSGLQCIAAHRVIAVKDTI